MAGRSKKPSAKNPDERPSDVKQWPSGQTEPAKLAKGRANLRAAKRSAEERSEAEAPKQQRAAKRQQEL
ncbi:hypothetical protein SGRA_4050 [Saprospira grandis str. Lewin]|uniref:Uncharacterized protein n=1 Tax=Saprospira grandis (strain Lewin) TaxID=984262 RepID=H6L793_SAPGL|nr:hypothetical protein SGRA_4050 [Saprospira grandis str. Lewin]